MSQTRLHFPTASPPEILHYLASVIRAVEGCEMNRFTRALEALGRVSARLQAPLAIVDGVAAIFHHLTPAERHSRRWSKWPRTGSR